MLFAVLELNMALTLTKQVNSDDDPLIPLKRDWETFEWALERRGVFADAAVGLLAHVIIYLSSETQVRFVAKLGYGIFMAGISYFGPITMMRIARSDDEGAGTFLKAEVAEKNFYIVASVAALNFAGAAAMLLSSETNSPAKKEKSK